LKETQKLSVSITQAIKKAVLEGHGQKAAQPVQDTGKREGARTGQPKHYSNQRPLRERIDNDHGGGTSVYFPSSSQWLVARGSVARGP
jgi:hypothetical protein